MSVKLCKLTRSAPFRLLQIASNYGVSLSKNQTEDIGCIGIGFSPFKSLARRAWRVRAEVVAMHEHVESAERQRQNLKDEDYLAKSIT